MAPAKVSAATALPGHTKKPSAGSRAVVPAIPLAMMPKATNKKPKGTSGSKLSTDSPAASLDAALIDQAPSAATTDRVAQDAGSQAAQKPALSTAKSVNGGAPNKASREVVTAGKAHEIDTLRAETHSNGTYEGPKDDFSVASTQNDSAATSVRDGESAATSATTAADSASLTADSAQAESGNHQPYPVVSNSRIDASHGPFPPGQSSNHVSAQPRADSHLDHMNFSAPRRMHHSHMSNGNGIMFGGFPDSHTPSPAQVSGGFVPPHLPPMNGVRPTVFHGVDHRHPSSAHNGFPAPMRPDVMPSPANMEGYGPGSTSTTQAHMDNSNANATRYGPPTPLSYHGSHASIDAANNVENGGPYVPTSGMPHPAHAAADLHGSQRPPVPPFPPFMPPHMYSQRSILGEDQLIESIDYFRSQFDNVELSDCTLELVYAKARHHPVKLSGHKLVLCRSPTLKQKVMSALRDAAASSTITVQSDDKHLRSDAWWMAVQRLYLHPLLNLPPMAGDANNNVDFAGDNGDRFEFCLGYAAAGHLLRLPDVHIRGLQIASDLLNWRTVELALEFILENTRQRHTDYNSEHEGMTLSFVEMEYGYGPETRILMDAIINFLAHAFPSNFELDVSVSDPPTYARIPPLPASPTVGSPKDGATPAIARGSHAQHRVKPSRLGGIKFGDLPVTNSSDPQSSSPNSTSHSSVLSRILLNLPFDELRAVLNFEMIGNSAWKTARDRARVTSNVIAAREARRLRAVQTIRNGAFPEARAIQERLSANRRYAIVEPWDVLNWRELSTFFEGDGALTIARNWVPEFDVNGRTGHSGHPRVGNVTQSMV